MAKQLPALRKTLKACTLTPKHAALVAMVEAMAAELDSATLDAPNTAALWKEYRVAVSALVSEGAAHDDQPGAQLLALVQTPMRPAVGHSAHP